MFRVSVGPFLVSGFSKSGSSSGLFLNILSSLSVGLMPKSFMNIFSLKSRGPMSFLEDRDQKASSISAQL